MKFYMHQGIFGENLIKIGLISSAQWRFPEERYQACPVTLRLSINQCNYIQETRTVKCGIYYMSILPYISFS